MAICNLSEMGAALAPGERVMGLDHGTKTIGVALSDVERSIATPREIIRRRRLAGDLERLRDIVAAERVGGIVVGLPINMNGSEGPRAQAARQFAADLTAALELPVALWDERLSTAAAERALLEADLSRKKRAAVIDKVAAAYILQGALDLLREVTPSPAQARSPITPR